MSAAIFRVRDLFITSASPQKMVRSLSDAMTRIGPFLLKALLVRHIVAGFDNPCFEVRPPVLR